MNRLVASVGEFERQVWQGRNEEAFSSLVAILANLSASGGALPQAGTMQPLHPFPGRSAEAFATRVAGAISELFSRADFVLGGNGFARLAGLHRWIGTLFAASSYANPDVTLTRLGMQPTREFIENAPPEALFKMCALYSVESTLAIDFDALFRRGPILAVSLAMALLSCRMHASAVAHRKREALLPWIAVALGRLESPVGLPASIFADLWMHCSYGLERDKHDLKRPLNRLLRRQIEAAGLREPALGGGDPSRPAVFVMLEWFHRRHSIMRTHSIAMQALGERYRLVGFGAPDMVDDAGRAMFHEFHPLGPFSHDLDFLKPVLELAQQRRPVATCFPSVGMALHSLYLVNIRLAPRQVMALGHPATSHSDKIDHVLVEEDHIGDASLFSEAVRALPQGALPFRRPEARPVGVARKPGGPVRIAVPAAIMKLNPVFLGVCREIRRSARHEAEFHFMLGGAPDLVHAHAAKAIASQVPGAVVHKTTGYDAYMSNLAACDLFANPFPFGNTNGIVDTVSCGLPGICLSGDEVHSHIDEGMFRRLKFPEWTIARTHRDYVRAALRLIDEPELRKELSRRIREERPDEVLYSGRPEAFAEEFGSLL